MSAAARAWLEQHVAAVPPTLQAAMFEALAAAPADRAPAGSAAEELAAAAVHCLRSALPQCGQRAGALPLLAADALISAACEAAAAEGGAALERLCAAWSPARLATLLHE